MTELHTIRGITYVVERARLRGHFPYSEGRANPMLWFGFDLRSRDVVAAGTPTKRECLAVLGEDAAERIAPILCSSRSRGPFVESNQPAKRTL
jgi:hypothetical protein